MPRDLDYNTFADRVRECRDKVDSKGEDYEVYFQLSIFQLLASCPNKSITSLTLSSWALLHPQRMKLSIKDFFSKCDQIRRLLKIWSHLLKISWIHFFCAVLHAWFRRSHPDVFCKKVVLDISQNSQENTSCRPATLLKRRLWDKCFPVNFEKFLKAPFYKEHLQWLFLMVHSKAITRTSINI